MSILDTPFVWRSIGLHTATFLLAASTSYAAAHDHSKYDTLIRQAQAGNTAPVLEYLRQVDIKGPSAARYVSDWIAVASWTGCTQEVVDLYSRWSSTLTLSASAHAVAARAFRDLRQWDASLEAYQRALQIEPGSTAYRIGQVHVLADAERDAEAQLAARQLLAIEPRDPMRILALAYVHTAAKRRFEALEVVTRAHDIASDNAQVEAAYIDALQSAGLPHQALVLAQASPNALSAPQLRRLRADAGAELVRLSYEPTTTEAERFKAADAALAMYDVLLQEWADSTEPSALQQLERVKIDRLSALVARGRMQEAVAAYEAMRKVNVVVHDYALRSVADAYLYLKQPAIARDLYAQLLSRDTPGSARASDDASGLFYSLSEAGEKREAAQLADRMAAELSPKLRVLGSPVRVPNDLWASAQEQAAQGQSFADATPEAQERMEDLLALAPGNVSLHISLAGVYGARSWPRRAEKELKLTESLAPRSIGLELQQGFTALDLSEWEQAELLSDDTVARHPENLQVQRLARRVEVQNMAEVRISGYRGLSSNNPAAGNADHGVDTVAYSVPIQRDWRIFGGVGWAAGDFPEGRGHHRILRAGADWRVRDNRAEFEISNHDFGYGNRVGVRLEAAHDLNDYWQIAGAMEKLSRDTPLRALRSNVTADSATVSVRWRASDRREWSFGVQPMQFSDGNSRLSASLLGRERLYTTPRYFADLAIEASTSRGVRQDGFYYNPAFDFTLVPRLDISHVIYQHYGNEWRQQMQLGAGVYQQRGFGSGPIYFIGYSQRLRLNDVFEAGVGISVTRRPYDGIRERNVRGTVDISMRF